MEDASAENPLSLWIKVRLRPEFFASLHLALQSPMRNSRLRGMAHSFAGVGEG
jgi:hypothetical protein